MPEQHSANRRAPGKLDANRPIARAMRMARGDRSQDEFAAALRAIGVPAARNQISAWELGSDPGAVSDIRNIAVVPAFALVGAAQVAGWSVTALLAAANRADAKGQDPLADRVAELERLIAEMREDMDTWLVDRPQLRSLTGMASVEPPERLRKQAEGEA